MPRWKQQTLEERFWSKVNKTPDCWLWTAARNVDGYGYFRVSGITRRAHRFSYELHFGKIPDGMQVLHKCDTPACVCPAHLFIGTNADNMHDKVVKGRWKGGFTPGSANPMAKLNEAAVEVIRGLYASCDHTQASLARQFGVSQKQISYIVNLKKWTHI